MVASSASVLCVAALAASAGAADPRGLPASGFGSHIEGVSMDPTGNVYATHFRNTNDSSFAGNEENRNLIGKVDAVTGKTSIFFTGPDGSQFNGMKWDPASKVVYLADVGRARVVKVDLETLNGTDVCGADGGLVGSGAPNDLALTKDGKIYLSGQDWASSTGGLWFCDPKEGSVVQLEKMHRTNGIALSPDDKYLYLTEAIGSPVSAHDVVDGQTIWRYDIDDDGNVSGKTQVIDFADGVPHPEAAHDSDGMRTDTEGNLYVTRNGAGKVSIIAPNFTLQNEIKLETTSYPTNLAIGDGVMYVCGRCGQSDWGTGDGCIEQIPIHAVGREWSWFTTHDQLEQPQQQPQSTRFVAAQRHWQRTGGFLAMGRTKSDEAVDEASMLQSLTLQGPVDDGSAAGSPAGEEL